MTVMRSMYQVTASALALPSEDTRQYVVSFLPMARVTAEDQSAIAGTTTAVQWP